jgi:glycosyltransferase involved in cell wall biosynthesis
MTNAENTPYLSALLVAHNEEKQIADCIRSVSFADEIVVVLDRCTDGSREICDDLGVQIVEGDWPIEGDRRNAGIDACNGAWILEIDADERASKTLGAEIVVAIGSAKAGVFLIKYENHIAGRAVMHGWGAYNGVVGKHALFAKGEKHWGRGRVHPATTMGEKIGEIQTPMTHYVYRDLSDMYARLNRYTDLAAEDMAELGSIPSSWKTLRRFFSRGFKSYVARSGYKEGWTGAALAFYSAAYPVLVHLKARERMSVGGK